MNKEIKDNALKELLQIFDTISETKTEINQMTSRCIHITFDNDFFVGSLSRYSYYLNPEWVKLYGNLLPSTLKKLDDISNILLRQ